MLAAREIQPGEWWMVDEGGSRYAIVLIVEIGPNDDRRTAYRVVTGESERRRLVGYEPTLRRACSRAHGQYLSEHGVKARGAGGPDIASGEVKPVYPHARKEYERLFSGR